MLIISLSQGWIKEVVLEGKNATVIRFKFDRKMYAAQLFTKSKISRFSSLSYYCCHPRIIVVPIYDKQFQLNFSELLTNFIAAPLL